jgi:monothiol glutaredoxin
MDQNTNLKIKNLLEKSDVCLFMKGTPEVPQCGFSLAVSNVLKHLNVKYNSVNVLEDLDIREGIKKFSDWPTIPQLYIKGEFIGGCDIIKEMFEKGELQTKLKEKNITHKEN